MQKKLVDKLIKERTENVDEIKIARMGLLEHRNEWVRSYTICIFLAVIVLTISVGIGSYFFYFHWYLKKDVTCVKFGAHTQTTIYWTYKWEKSNKTNWLFSQHN